MLNQSFPPMSVLRGIKSLAVKIDSATDLNKTLHRMIELATASKLTGAGIKLVAIDAPCDALLRCHVSTIATVSAGGYPTAFAYVVRLDMLTALASQPSEELFIIWQDIALGHTSASGLLGELVESTELLTLGLVTRLMESQR